MKLITRLTTALFCSAIMQWLSFAEIAFGLTIPGDAETTITDSSQKNSSFDRVFLNSEVTSNQNKQTENKQSSQEIVGEWVGTNQNGIKITLTLNEDGKFVLIAKAPDRKWNFNSGVWSYSNDKLLLTHNKNNNLNLDSITTNSINWISNNEIIYNDMKLFRTDPSGVLLNQINHIDISGTWSIKHSPGMGLGLNNSYASSSIRFNSDGTYQYQKVDVSAQVLGAAQADETNISGTWNWSGNILYINDVKEGLIGQVYWISSPNKFEYVQPGNDKILIFERNN